MDIPFRGHSSPGVSFLCLSLLRVRLSAIVHTRTFLKHVVSKKVGEERSLLIFLWLFLLWVDLPRSCNAFLLVDSDGPRRSNLSGPTIAGQAINYARV